VAGALLCVLAPAAYVLQLRLRYLGTPWYLPLLATAGVALMGVSLWRRRGVVRGLILVPFLLLCGMEWFFVAVASRTPPYAGPARPGRAVPRFATTRADGSSFTQEELAKGTATVLVFFRGRW
jgi:hypothetical protein